MHIVKDPDQQHDEWQQRQDEEVAELGPVRFSHLRAYGRSPMHGWHSRTKESKETAAMERGTAVHAILFGTRRVCAYPGSQRRGKEYEAFAADNADAEILTQAEYSKAMSMAIAVENCTLAKPMLKGIYEETILFDWMGLKCRATPDVRGTDFLTELKTSSSSDPAKFQWQALRMHYHAQMRMQQIACKDSLVQDCFVVCVEAAEPWPVTVYRIDEKALEAGEKMLVLWAERLKNSERSGQFPGYSQCVMPIDLPDDTDLDLVFPEDKGEI